MIGLKQVLDYDDYAAIPPDGKRYELIEGDVHVTPSPTPLLYDRTTKSRRYAALGVPHFWLIEPEPRRLECYRLQGSAYQRVAVAERDVTIESTDWPGLVIRLGDLGE